MEDRMSHIAKASGLIALALLAAGAALPAEAKIACKDGYQIVSGAALATPYCQDELVAEVAREYGMKVSAHAIRYNPNLKRNVCQFVGRDIRIQQACIDANTPGRGRAF
jgi:hypothetical protein